MSNYTHISSHASILFQDTTPDTTPVSRRGLQLQDPRIFTAYLKHLQQHLAYHKLPEKIETLHNHAQQYPNDPTIAQQYNKIDKLLTEGMLAVEKRSCKKYSDKFQWSPALAKAVNVVHYWRLCMKQAKGIIVSNHHLIKAVQLAALKEENKPMTTTSILTNPRVAHQTLRNLQKRHIELRENHLESLAEARIIHARPDLTIDPDNLQNATEKEIRRIFRIGRSRRSHRAVRRCLRPQTTRTALTRIEVPTDKNADPKTWNGLWKTITEPEEIATSVCHANTKQYHQACETTFASGPLLSYIGPSGAGPGAKDILKGKLPPETLLNQLLPETRSILQTLADMPIQPNLQTEQTHITQDWFQSLYKTLMEKISS
jgi:hypothetical protein